jgi:hypothetical protein
MEFIKKNYEKIILSIVLLALVGVLALMPGIISADQRRMADLPGIINPKKPEPLAPLDLSRQQAAMERLKSPYNLDLATTNKLFNPVTWKRNKNGRIVKVLQLGPSAAVVTKITPLYFSISLDSVTISPPVGTNEASARYVFTLEDQSATLLAQRRPRRQYASKGEMKTDKTVAGKNEGFTVVDVKGPPENPDQLILKLADSQTTVPVAKGKPFRRADAYAADLRYDTDSYHKEGVRVGEHLTFAGDDYNVIAIDKNSVSLLAQSNQRKYTLPYAP